MNLIQYDIKYDNNFIPILYKIREINMPKIKCKNEVVLINNIMKKAFDLSHMMEEYCYIIAFFDLKILGIYQVSHGTEENCDMEMKNIYRFLIMIGANNYYIVHNHPNCSSKMSQDDYVITNKLFDCNRLFHISLKNHIVIGDDGYRCIDDEIFEMIKLGINNVEDYYGK